MNPLFWRIRSIVQHYDHEKYWRLRNKITQKKGTKLSRLICLYRIKRMDAKNCASMGTNLAQSAYFASTPQLPHGLYGIIVTHNAVIGSNCTTYHQVTIGQGNGGAPTIGDNVYIGAGAKIIGNVKIGNNVKIGANAVVLKNIEDNCTVVGVPAKVVKYTRHV